MKIPPIIVILTLAAVFASGLYLGDHVGDDRDPAEDQPVSVVMVPRPRLKLASTIEVHVEVTSVVALRDASGESIHESLDAGPEGPAVFEIDPPMPETLVLVVGERSEE